MIVETIPETIVETIPETVPEAVIPKTSDMTKAMDALKLSAIIIVILGGTFVLVANKRRK